ncbi:unnamed protein product, partial [Mesorhabditis spiculigera]
MSRKLLLADEFSVYSTKPSISSDFNNLFGLASFLHQGSDDREARYSSLSVRSGTVVPDLSDVEWVRGA